MPAAAGDVVPRGALLGTRDRSQIEGIDIAQCHGDSCQRQQEALLNLINTSSAFLNKWQLKGDYDML